MTLLTRYLVRMIGFMVLVGAIAGYLFMPLVKVFQHNPLMNALILGVLLFGIMHTFYRLFSLRREQVWLERYEAGREQFPGTPTPKILSPIATALSEFKGTPVLSTMTLRSLLSSIDGRLDSLRDATRYMTGLLIFLGLLGTFWGLSQTIASIAGVIGKIDFGADNLGQAFQNLKQALESPLSGMGIAFSSSMFGVAGSLIIGFLDLQASKASGDFYHSLEDQLLTLTRNTLPSASEEVTHHGPAYTQSLLEQAAENMGQLQVLIRRGEDNRTSVVKSVQNLGEKLSLLTEQMLSHQSLIKKIAQNQMELQDNLGHLASSLAGISMAGGLDETVKAHLRNIDATSIRLLEEMVEGRNRTIQELRAEIKLVARTISALADGQEIAA